jgi:serine/threonine protein kinase
VESLLAAHDRAGDFLSTAAATPLPDVLSPGAQLGPYRIDAKLGQGGMGTVHRALDTRLNRPVAIKFLSSELADASAQRRFQREAQMASALNHPHVLTVHDAGEWEGRQYLVTE